MSQYEVVVSKSAANELSKLQTDVNNRIVNAILKLEKTQGYWDRKSSKVDQKTGELGSGVIE